VPRERRPYRKGSISRSIAETTCALGCTRCSVGDRTPTARAVRNVGQRSHAADESGGERAEAGCGCPRHLGRARTLFVSAASVPGGDGSAESPNQRITDALDRARALRAATDAPIIVRVSPGTYVGSYRTTGPTIEALPLILNIPNLVLRGSTELVVDGNGLPTGAIASGATILTHPPVETLRFDADLIYIGAAGTKVTQPDGTVVPDPATVTRGDCVFVEGFSLSHAGGNAVEADRVQNFAVSRNIQQGGVAMGLAGGVVTRGASGVIEGNFLTQDTGGVFALGGNANFPADVLVVGNRMIQDGNGIIAKGSPWGIQPVGAPANPLAGVPFADVFEMLSIEISGNDLSENAGSKPPLASQGIKIGVVFDHAYPPSAKSPCTDPRVVIRGDVDAFVHDNRIAQNDIGVVVDGDYPYRTFNHVADCRLFEGRIDVTFKDNDVTGNLRTPLALTFTRNIAATDRTRLDPKKSATSFQYVQNSVFSVSDPDAFFAGGWLDHPLTDPIDGRTLHNRFFLNGDEVPAPIRSYPYP
jgi:hypothetical protein